MSAVLAFDPKLAPTGNSKGTRFGEVRLMRTAPLGNISTFGSSDDPILWREPDGIHTAPLAGA